MAALGWYVFMTVIPYVIFYIAMLFVLLCAMLNGFYYLFKLRLYMDNMDAKDTKYLKYLQYPSVVMRKIGDTWLDYIVKHKYKSKDGQIEIRGYTFTEWWSKIYKLQMSLIPITIIFASATVFWEVFWIETTYDCDTTTSGLDCFDGNSFDSARLNCSQYVELPKDNQTDVVCYRFVFDLTLALGAAGGILTLGTVVTAVYIAFITCVLGLGRCGKVFFYLSNFSTFLPTIILVLAIQYDFPLVTVLYITTAMLLMLVLTFNIAWIYTEPPPPNDDDEDLTPPCCNFQCCKRQRKEHTLIQSGDNSQGENGESNLVTAHPDTYGTI